MYELIRPLLFQLDPEHAHRLALTLLRYVPALCFSKPAHSEYPIHALGLQFPHPVGLAAGFDKNGDYLEALAKLGFSFIEIGTVTPRPQVGNPKPRLFRLPEVGALINRMGFNNRGVDAMVATLASSTYQGILGINIGKNKDTPLDGAVDDYRECFQKTYPYADYVVINLSSPNTPQLRELQGATYFHQLMSQLRDEQHRLSDIHQVHVPMVIKLSPDESVDDLKRMAHTVVELGIEGLMATNTTAERGTVRSLRYGDEVGGLSGRPLLSSSTECLRIIKQAVGDAVTLIGVGGVDSIEAASEKLVAGADLLQVYTGLIYQGPGWVQRLVNEIQATAYS